MHFVGNDLRERNWGCSRDGRTVAETGELEKQETRGFSSQVKGVSFGKSRDTSSMAIRRQTGKRNTNSDGLRGVVGR